MILFFINWIRPRRLYSALDDFNLPVTCRVYITRARALMMTKSSNLILNLNLILGFFGFLWVSFGYFGFRWVFKKPRKTDWVFSVFEKGGVYTPPGITLEITSLPANR